MRPYPDEIIQGLRWSLENAIIPDLTEDWTKQVAANCLTLLNILELRWENEPVLLAEDIDDMRGLFEESLSAFGHPPLSDNARVSALGQELRQTLGADYSVDDGSGPFVRLATENEACRGMLIKLIDGLEDAAEGGTHPEEFEALRDRVNLLLRRQTDRDSMLALPGSKSPRPDYGKQEDPDDEA